MSTHPIRSQGMPLIFKARIKFHMENTYGAKIYKDFMNRYAVKVEDHLTDFDPSPWVNYQEDRYVSKDGSIYLLVNDPHVRNTLGKIETRDVYVDERPFWWSFYCLFCIYSSVFQL